VRRGGEDELAVGDGERSNLAEEVGDMKTTLEIARVRGKRGQMGGQALAQSSRPIGEVDATHDAALDCCPGPRQSGISKVPRRSSGLALLVLQHKRP
jgi:hypothetical protein